MSRWLRVALNMNSVIGKEVQVVDSTNKKILSDWKGKSALFDFYEGHVVLHFADGHTGGTSNVESIKRSKDGSVEVHTKNSVYKFEAASEQSLFEKKVKKAADIIGYYSRKNSYTESNDDSDNKNNEQEMEKVADEIAKTIVDDYYRLYYYSDELISKIMEGARSIVTTWTMFGNQIPYSDICDAIDNCLD